jgi:hypothetical protein
MRVTRDKLVKRLTLLGIVIAALGTCSCSGASTVTARNDEVLLLPHLDAGWAGWCLVRLSSSEGGCPVVRSNRPILAETWSSGDSPSVTTGYAVTTSEVRSVSIDGSPPIPTRAETALPSELRTVVVEVRGGSFGESPPPRFRPLNARREVIPQATQVIRDQTQISEPLAVTVPTRRVSNPAQATFGICRIAASRVAGLTMKGGSVVTRVGSYSGLVGQGFLSCASTSYDVSGWPMLAGVLVDASRPGTTPPALPGMRPLRGEPGIFQTAGSERPAPEGDWLARRVRGGWLVVSGAEPRQRLTLLKHLRATVAL